MPFCALKFSSPILRNSFRTVPRRTHVLDLKRGSAEMKVALLHAAPVPGDLKRNRRWIDVGIEKACECGADWIVVPEAGLTGYFFRPVIGLDWIVPARQDPWINGICKTTAARGVTIFLSVPEKDAETGLLHNSTHVISEGAIIGTQRKIMCMPGVGEGWATPGPAPPQPIDVGGVSVGVLICADAYPVENALALGKAGAQVLLSPSSWAEGLHGPNGEWEEDSRRTGLPLIVCNRSGFESDDLDFTGSHSAVVTGGVRKLDASPSAPSLLMFHIDVRDWRLLDEAFEEIALQCPREGEEN